ncbi:hypothetical protein MBAV_000878 [Candidatus Magnetobacterium bavaricum]|uniref:Uncharacterized protein n=1 Tax=Candidatus Magnetobacterium bavaricum TaxID=29290 RepID=A0A0F3GY87_9BACT|nr:hypothetical protein MBAV_000878 [Candidatus Magnetobacterium bavaricum]
MLAMIFCKSSIFLPLMRTWSFWISAVTLSLRSLTSLVISFAFSMGMPCCRDIFWRTVPPAAGSILP